MVTTKPEEMKAIDLRMEYANEKKIAISCVSFIPEAELKKNSTKYIEWLEQKLASQPTITEKQCHICGGVGEHTSDCGATMFYDLRPIKIDVWDWVVTKGGKVVQITHDDMYELPYEEIERKATVKDMAELVRKQQVPHTLSDKALYCTTCKSTFNVGLKQDYCPSCNYYSLKYVNNG